VPVAASAATAETLARAGHTVYASMRGLKGKNRDVAEALQALGIKTVELDVTDDASVAVGRRNLGLTARVELTTGPSVVRSPVQISGHCYDARRRYL
jgi:hypothetical protein